MSDPESEVKALGRESRRTALLTLLSFVLVASALLYSAYRLEQLQREVNEKRQEVETLEHILEEREIELRSLNEEVVEIEQQLVLSRHAAEFVRSGINHYQRGEFSAAVAAYRKALDIDPSNFVVYDWMGYAYYRNGQLTEALESLQRAVALSPDYARGYYNLALALWRSGDRDKAVAAVARAIELDPPLRDNIRSDGQFAPFRQSEAFRTLIEMS